MSEGKIPLAVDDCAEKPKLWDDDMKMDAWFAPFRNRDVNPLNYDNKMVFWKNNFEYMCDKAHKCSLTLSQLRSFCVRNGKTPHCLAPVFETMLKEGTIQELGEFEKFLANSTWTGWAVNTLVSSPMKWLSKKMVTAVSTPASEIDETTEYIHLPSLKKFAENLRQCVTKEIKDNIVTYEEVRSIYSKHINVPVDTNMVKILVQWLHFQKMVDIQFEDKHCHIHLLKFSVNSKPVVPISDSEVSVCVLQTQEKLLSGRIQELEAEEKKLTDEVKNYLRLGQKNTARSVLRKRKEVDKRIDKVLKALENIQTLLYRVEETESDAKILHTYKVGAHALKSELTKGSLDLNNVDDTMDEVEEILNKHADMEETLGHSLGPQLNDAELEDELSELMLNDLPSVPPGSPSRNKSLSEDLPEVPKEIYQSPPGKRHIGILN